MPDAWPDIPPNEADFWLEPHTHLLRSPITRGRRAIRGLGARWVASFVYSSMTAPEWNTIHTFVAKIGGPVGEILLRDYAYEKQGNAGGTIVVDGGAQTGFALAVSGITGTNPAFRTGDRVSIEGRLHMITADVNHSGGNATLPIAPMLRSTPTDQATVVYATPLALMGLTEDSAARLRHRPGRFGAMTLNFEEWL